MTTNDLITVARDFLAECSEDYVGLWSLVWRIRRTGAVDDSDVRKTTLDLVAPLLSKKESSRDNSCPRVSVILTSRMIKMDLRFGKCAQRT